MQNVFMLILRYCDFTFVFNLDAYFFNRARLSDAVVPLRRIKLGFVIRFNLVMYRYSSFAAYDQSKLANVLHANELARRLKVCDLFHALKKLSVVKFLAIRHF